MESQQVIEIDAADTEIFEGLLKSVIYENKDFSAILIDNFGAALISNYFSLFEPDKIIEELNNKKYGK